MTRRFTRILAALALLVGLTIPMGMWGQTTYSLQHVTTVEVGGLYVFERNNHVFNNVVESKALQTTIDYANSGLTGNETYVWTLEATTTSGQFKMKNVSLSNNSYLNNASGKTDMSFGTASSEWTFSFEDGVVLIQNAKNSNRFLGETSQGSNAYKAYAINNLDSYGHDITVYKLVAGGTPPTPTCATPTFNPAAGTYTQAQNVTISCATEGATIYYTTNGDEPTTNSTVYTAAINVSTNTTIKAMAAKADYNNSPVASATYTIVQPISGYAIDFEQEASLYTDWTFTNMTSHVTGDITAHGGTYYGTTGGKTTASVKTSTAIAAPGTLTCFVSKASTNSNPATWYIQVSEDGNTWQNVGEKDAASMNKGEWIEFTADLSSYSNVYVRVYYDGNTAVRTIDDLSLTMNNNPAIVADDVEIAYDATNGSIAYTITNGVEGGAVTSAVVTTSNPENWLTVNGSNLYTSPISLSCAANTTATEKTATVTLTYTYNRETVTATVNVTQTADPNATMTIAEVRALNTGTTVATKGVVTSISVSGNNKTAYFQDNTAGIVAYGPFTTTVAVGDEIRVEGELTSYNGLLEIGKSSAAPTVTVLSQNNTVTPVVKTIAEISNDIQAQLVKVEDVTVTNIDGQNTTIAQDGNTIVVRGISGVEYAVNDVLTLTANVGCYDNPQLVNPQNVEVHAVPSITIESNAFELTANEEEGYLDITYDNFNPISFDIMFCDANGNELSEDPDWIMLAIEAPEGEEGDFVYYVAGANDGEARTAYFKVYASLGEGQETVYSNLVTVTQAAPVVDYATLPFNWEGGTKEELTALNGVTGSGLGSNYAESNAPYRVKFDNQGDYILVKTDSQPGKVTIGIKNFGSSTGTIIAVQESSNGSDFTEVEELTITCSQNKTQEFETSNSFNASSRYVRLYDKTHKSNFGVGPITIAKPATESLQKTLIADRWYIIASPFAGTVTTNAMDASNLYFYDEQDHFWRSKTLHENDFDFASGTGYLCGNKNDNFLLTFEGTVSEDDIMEIPLTYHATTTANEDNPLAGWNLVGNPFATTAAISNDYYIMNEDGDGLIVGESNVVDAMQGVFVQATPEDQTVIFEKAEVGVGGGDDKLVVNLSQNRSNIIDRAIVRMGEGRQLPKFQLFEGNTKLYIPQDGQDYAVVRSEGQGELPVNFRASENGTYTLSMDVENMDMNYLHLIDNMTGMDIDLLQTPSYTFDAKVNDYESRFRLVFAANNEDGVSTSSTTFAFYSNGNWIINNAGEATLQVVDLTGRILSSETVNGSVSKTINAVPGVYMLRLINGDNVNVQKIVVR